jgi:hypothetical protein
MSTPEVEAKPKAKRGRPPKVVPNERRVEIRLRDPKRTGTVTMRGYTHPDTKKWTELLDSHGNKRVIKYTRAKKILDLSNEDDRLEYEHMKDHPEYVRGPQSIIKLVDLKAEADDFIAAKDLESEVNAIIKDLSGDDMIDFARSIGVLVDGNGPTAIKRGLYEEAEKTPQMVLDQWNAPDRTLREMLHKGRSRRIFTVDNGYWKYRQQVMGSDFESALIWLKENEDMLPSIRKEIKEV